MADSPSDPPKPSPEKSDPGEGPDGAAKPTVQSDPEQSKAGNSETPKPDNDQKLQAKQLAQEVNIDGVVTELKQYVDTHFHIFRSALSADEERIFSRKSLTNILMVVSTIIVAAYTWQMSDSTAEMKLYAKQQTGIMHEQLDDLARSIAQNDILTTSAVKQAQAAIAQAGEALRANKISMDNAQKQLRPYVVLSLVESENGIFRAFVKNVGQTPAVNVLVNVRTSIIEKDRLSDILKNVDPDQMENNPNRQYFTLGSGIEHGIFVKPVVDMIEYKELEKFLPDQIDNLNKGNYVVLLSGIARYLDLEGIKHHTRFCVMYERDASKGYVLCQTNNDIN